MNNLNLIPRDISEARTKRNIYFRLVNTAKNRSLISNVPNLRFYDMSVVFYYSARPTADPKNQFLIDNECARSWNMDENSLYKLSLANTRNSFGVSIVRLENLLRFLLGDAFEHPEIVLKSELDKSMLQKEYDDMLLNEFREDMLEEIYGIPKAMNIFVLTNNCNHFGAVCMLYKEIRAFADQLADDLYIIPSSIHEVLLVPCSSGINRYELENILNSINTNVLSPDDFLSDHVYKYTRADKKIIY